MSEQGNGALAAPQQQGALAAPGGRGQLAAALAKAQRLVRRVDHDARNSFHGYDYTSSEAVIEAAKDPLADNGLSLLPLEETLNGHQREGADRFELECKFVLLHASGESLPLVRHWPVCPEKGRPLDKATAAASTLALAYLLRDLLLMPRVAPQDEVSAREERPAQQQPRKAKDAPPPPKDGAELEQRLANFDAACARKGLCAAGDVLRHVGQWGQKAGYPAEVTRWPAEAVEKASAEAKAFAERLKQPKGRPAAAAAV
jgi:hypothetical protein